MAGFCNFWHCHRKDYPLWHCDMAKISSPTWPNFFSSSFTSLTCLHDVFKQYILSWNKFLAKAILATFQLFNVKNNTSKNLVPSCNNHAKIMELYFPNSVGTLHSVVVNMAYIDMHWYRQQPLSPICMSVWRAIQELHFHFWSFKWSLLLRNLWPFKFSSVFFFHGKTSTILKLLTFLKWICFDASKKKMELFSRRY